MHTTTPTEPTLIRQMGLAYFPVALAARLPFAMMVVGLLTLVVATGGSLTLAGAVSAAAGLGMAIFGPWLGAAADRRGQRPVLLVVGLANSLVLVAMAGIVYTEAPDFVVLVLAFFVGATAPQVSPLSRSRLVGVISGHFPPEKGAKVLGPTMAYESTADEIVFVFGPVLVGLLATTMNPAAPVLCAAALTAVFVIAFALHPSAMTTPRSELGYAITQAPARELRRPALLVTIAGTLGMGLFFGSMFTSLTSFMSDLGRPEQAGLMYGAMGIGSAVFALAAAWFPSRFTLNARWVVFGGIGLLGTAALSSMEGLVACAAVLLVVGIGIGPTLVTLYHLAAQRSPLGRSATVMTMLGSGVVVGQAVSAALTGWLAETVGTTSALLVPAAAMAVVFAAGIGNTLLSRRSSVEDADENRSEQRSPSRTTLNRSANPAPYAHKE